MWKIIKAIKEYELKLLSEKILKYGKQDDMCYTCRFSEDEKDFPIIAGYWNDEPCDIIITEVTSDEDKFVSIKGMCKDDQSCEKYIPADDIFVGQLQYIIDAI